MTITVVNPVEDKKLITYSQLVQTMEPRRVYVAVSKTGVLDLIIKMTDGIYVLFASGAYLGVLGVADTFIEVYPATIEDVKVRRNK